MEYPIEFLRIDEHFKNNTSTNISNHLSGIFCPFDTTPVCHNITQNIMLLRPLCILDKHVSSSEIVKNLE